MQITLDAATREKWDSYLALAAKAGACNAMICGGAVRDTLLGVVVEDVDIFHEGEVDPDDLPDRLLHVGGYDPDYPLIKRRVVIDDQERLDFLQVESVQAHLGIGFSADISEVFYSPKGLVLSPAFLQAVDSRIITFRTHADKAYIAKIRRKFGPLGFTFAQQRLVSVKLAEAA